MISDADVAAAREAFGVPHPGVERVNRCAFCQRLTVRAVCFACHQRLAEAWPDDPTPTE